MSGLAARAAALKRRGLEDTEIACRLLVSWQRVGQLLEAWEASRAAVDVQHACARRNGGKSHG